MLVVAGAKTIVTQHEMSWLEQSASKPAAKKKRMKQSSIIS